MNKKRRPVQVLLRKEFIDVKKNPRSDFFQVHGKLLTRFSLLDLVKDNLQVWEIYVIGPPETPYSKGVYKALLKFPDEYPMKPPTLKFICKMYHPNIYKDGKVCISTLQTGKDGSDSLGQYWRPVLGVEQAILSVVSLLSDPNLDDPADVGAANLFKKDKKRFKERCEELAIASLSYVPDSFQFPEMNHAKDSKKPVVDQTAKDVAKAPQNTEREEDEWSYDAEDISRSTRASLISRKSVKKDI